MIIHLLVDNVLQRAYGLREEMDELEDECLAVALAVAFKIKKWW